MTDVWRYEVTYTYTTLDGVVTEGTLESPKLPDDLAEVQRWVKGLSWGLRHFGYRIPELTAYRVTGKVY